MFLRCSYLECSNLFCSVVDEKCLPYTGRNEKCHIPRKGNLKTARCLPSSNPDRTDKYRVAPAYRLGNETDIMYDIIHSGPVQGRFCFLFKFLSNFFFCF